MWQEELLPLFQIHNLRSWQSAQAEIVFWVSKNVNALIYAFSLIIHSFVPFQQFVSDTKKLDYQCDMSGIF